ncbi:MAG: glycosyltransferase family 9 protein [Candidatus Binatia bacterium]|nr:glycosyltransferase family 9 protein [Candidatus Binatia bacterium]
MTSGVSADRFLLIRLSAVGDVINTLPTLSLLRRARPDATIGFVVEDRAQDLLVDHPLVDRVHVFPRRRWGELRRSPGSWGDFRSELSAYAKEIRGVGYQVAIDVQGNVKGGVHALLSGAPHRIGFARGYDRELNHWFSTDRVVPPSDRPHRVDKFASLLGPLGIEDAAREWVFPNTEEADCTIRSYLHDNGIAPGEAVMLHPGTSGRGASKRWPPERFAEFARRVASELEQPVIVTWGPAEESLARDVAAGSDRVFAAPRTTSLLELLALVRMARLFVSADTGPMHLAAASGIPCVALFGPKDPAVYAPYGEGHTVLYQPEGMDQISVDEVVAAAGRELG